MARRSVVIAGVLSIVAVVGPRSAQAEVPQVLGLTGGSFAVPVARDGEHVGLVTQLRIPVSTATWASYEGFKDWYTSFATSPATNTHVRTGALALGATSLDVVADVTQERIPAVTTNTDGTITRTRSGIATTLGGLRIGWKRNALRFASAARVVAESGSDAGPTNGGAFDASVGLDLSRISVATAIGVSVLMLPSQDIRHLTRGRISGVLDVWMTPRLRAGGYVIADAETWLDHSQADQRQQERTIDTALYLRAQIWKLPEGLLALHLVQTPDDRTVELSLLTHFED